MSIWDTVVGSNRSNWFSDADGEECGAGAATVVRRRTFEGMTADGLAELLCVPIIGLHALAADVHVGCDGGFGAKCSAWLDSGCRRQIESMH